jgi:hypothetical protein
MKSKKVINDPVYGFLTIPSKLIFKVISHPYFQRLRRIRQLGLTDYVYPGALHTRFHHALGAMSLMATTLDNLRGKGHKISKKEYESALLAILLHDIGHGPFSHVLEHTLLQGVHHESMSLLLMEALNREFDGRLDMAIQIFTDQYPRQFFHQLVSSQLDMDRLDYLQRDCFFTGVVEGNVGVKRILKMLDVHEDRIVVEEKGIYSIENFLTARRLMYWQVYLHKTTVSTEQMIVKLMERARALAGRGEDVPSSPALRKLLYESVSLEDFAQRPDYLQAFASLDDYDIWGSIKYWAYHSDAVLQPLSGMLLERKLFRTSFLPAPLQEGQLELVREGIRRKFKLSEEDAWYFYAHGVLSNAGYNSAKEVIVIKTKRGELLDIAQASDLPNIQAMSHVVRKPFVSCPKGIRWE